MRSFVYLIKKQSKLPLWFPHPFTKAVSPLPHEESHFSFPLTALIGQRSGHKGFSCARRTVKQTAPKDRKTKKKDL